MQDATLLDQPKAMRAEDAIDGAAVDRLLKERLGDLDGYPEIAQFHGGASNLTYLLRYSNRDLILRRPPIGAKVKSAHDVLREARIMAALRPAYPYVPAIITLGDDPAVLGCDFYVMERIVGIIPRRDLPPGLTLTPDATRRLCQNVVDKLIELHAVDPAASGLAAIGKGAGYIRRQIDGWSERWRQALTDGIEPMPEVLAWLDRVAPPGETAICVIHNDYRFDNVVLAPDDPLRVVGVLDWEMATLGDPLMDLGGALAYWVQADDDASVRATRRQPTDAQGMLTRAEVIAYYAEKTGLSVETFDFYAVFGLFRLAVIIQQIYRRYVLKLTTNPTFSAYGDAVNDLARRCRAMIAQSAL